MNGFVAAREAAKIALGEPMRASAMPDPSAVRLVPYESCRGLEGWITVALDLDDFQKDTRRHSNQNASDPQTDPTL